MAARSGHVLPGVRVPQRAVEGRRHRHRERPRLPLTHPPHSRLQGAYDYNPLDTIDDKQ